MPNVQSALKSPKGRSLMFIAGAGTSMAWATLYYVHDGNKMPIADAVIDLSPAEHDEDVVLYGWDEDAGLCGGDPSSKEILIKNIDAAIDRILEEDE